MRLPGDGERTDTAYQKWRRRIAAIRLSTHEKQQLAASAGDPEAVEVLMLLFGVPRGIRPPGPVHPVTGASLTYPLTEDECAAINHAGLAQTKGGRERLRELDCECGYCRTLRSEDQ